MKDGFYTALGTPLDKDGSFVAASFEKQVEDQVDANASGLLVMGSMGIQPHIKQSEFSKIAKSAVHTAKGACPVLVGVMDNSVSRVMDRIYSLKDLKIDGVVATTPFYYTSTQEEITQFFENIASLSPFPLYLYDLPLVTKVKISVKTAENLMANKNIKGIKTGDITTARVLMRSEKKKDDFSVMFSGLDVFDIAYKYGLKQNLDGMFSCTPSITSRLYKSLENNDFEQAGKYLDDILMLRDTFIDVGVFKGFTHAMNLLGYEGIFSPDYSPRDNDGSNEKVEECMRKLALI